MFLIPLNQQESVQLVIHALRVAGGMADCSSCPVRRVCMKQCLTIAESVQGMLDSGTLPALASEEESAPAPPVSAQGSETETPAPPAGKNGHLTIIK
jgi:hypothetical protein